MTPDRKTGVTRIMNAFFFSMQGFRACFQTEEAFKQEVFLALFMIPAGLYWGEGAVEKVLLVSSVVLVLLMEILNSAIERAIDRISFEKHELSKEAKDMGSAAVFLSLVMAGVTWALILGAKLF